MVKEAKWGIGESRMGFLFLKKEKKSYDWVEAIPRWPLDASLPVSGNRCGPNGSPGTSAAPLKESFPEREAGEDEYLKKKKKII